MSKDFTNLVKQKMWQFNHRAKTRGQKGNVILMDNKKVVYVVTGNKTPPANGWNVLARVFDYEDHQRIKFYDKSGKELKKFLWLTAKA